MKLENFAVIGHPIGHTMSPFIHERLFKRSGFAPKYSVFDVPELAKGLDELKKLDGFNITIPHKSGILPYLDEIDRKAELFGSVNTVRVEDGRMCGYTTDGAGCRMALGRYGFDLNGELLLLGRGGAARAIAFEAVMTADAPRLDIACRESSAELAKELCAELSRLCTELKKDGKFRVLSYDALDKEDKRYTLILNTTSVGMYPNAGMSVVGSSVLERGRAVFDAVYNPGETELLRLARESGATAIGGMGMLVCQAVKAHEIWYGASFKEDDIEQLIRDAEAETERIFRR